MSKENKKFKKKIDLQTGFPQKSDKSIMNQIKHPLSVIQCHETIQKSDLSGISILFHGRTFVFSAQDEELVPSKKSTEPGEEATNRTS